MAFAMVIFCDGNEVSEVPDNWLFEKKDESYCWWPPAHVKNITSLIANRAKPNKSTWLQFRVTVEKYCNIIEEARKIAEDSQYTSTDKAELGKGHRKPKSIKKYLDLDVESGSDESKSEESDTLQKNKKTKSDIPLFPVKYNNNSQKQNINTKSITVSQTNHDLEVLNNKEPSISSTLRYNEYNDEKDVSCHLKRIEEKLDKLTKMYAVFKLDFNDIKQRMNRITPVVKICGPTENIRKFLPLTSIEEIENFERFLKEEDNLPEYKTFIGKVGAHSACENIKRVLSSIFDDKLS